jgi:hypothetical protein
MPLPKWVTDNRTAVLDEAAPYVDMTDEQRFEILRSVCRVGARQLADHADRDRVLAWRDPLPRSSVELLRRLQREYRERHGRT